MPFWFKDEKLIELIGEARSIRRFEMLTDTDSRILELIEEILKLLGEINDTNRIE